jgi:hypothetical protein
MEPRQLLLLKTETIWLLGERRLLDETFHHRLGAGSGACVRA